MPGGRGDFEVSNWSAHKSHDNLHSKKKHVEKKEGREGAKGQTGDKGSQGMLGPKGDRGPEGSRGKSGTPGMMGIKGERGLAGNQGSKGDKGQKGASGAASPASAVPQTNWKQCVWKKEDAIDNGKIKVTDRVLKQASKVFNIAVLFSGTVRLWAVIYSPFLSF